MELVRGHDLKHATVMTLKSTVIQILPLLSNAVTWAKLLIAILLTDVYWMSISSIGQDLDLFTPHILLIWKSKEISGPVTVYISIFDGKVTFLRVRLIEFTIKMVT